MSAANKTWIGRYKIWIFLSAVAVGLLTDSDTGTPMLFYGGIAVTVTLIALIFILPGENKIYPFMFLVLACPDLTKSTSDMVEGVITESATFWQFHLWILQPSWILAIVILYLIIFIPRSQGRIQAVDKVFIFYFACVPVLTALFYGSMNPDNLEEIITDAKYPVILMSGIILFTKWIGNSRERFTQLMFFSLILIAGRVSADMFYLVCGVEKTLISGVSRVSVDSAKGITALLAYFLIARIALSPRKIIPLLLFPLVTFLLIAYQTRMLILCFIFGLIFLFFLMPFSTKLSILGLFGLVILPLCIGLGMIFPDVVDITEKRFRINLVRQGEDVSIEEMDEIRVLAVENIFAQMGRDNAYLTGMGYGGWYTDDDFPFPLEEKMRVGSFSNKSWATGRFYRIHDYATHIFLKFGLIGLVLSTWLFCLPAYKVIIGYRRLNDKLKLIAFVLIGFFPIVILTFFWTSKVIFIAAIYIVCLRFIADALIQGKEEHDGNEKKLA